MEYWDEQKQKDMLKKQTTNNQKKTVQSRQQSGRLRDDTKREQEFTVTQSIM